MITKDQVYHDQPGRIITEDQMVECIPAKRYRQMMEKLTELEHRPSLRVEALRAAVASVGVVVGYGSGGGATVNISDDLTRPTTDEILERADKFKAWLEPQP